VWLVADTHRLPRPVTAHWDWQMHAACRGMDSDVFFHPEQERGAERTEREDRAKSVCRMCPVIAACRRHALAAQEPYGVWGGLSVDERHTLLQRHTLLRGPDLTRDDGAAGADGAPADPGRAVRGRSGLSVADRRTRSWGPDRPP